MDQPKADGRVVRGHQDEHQSAFREHLEGERAGRFSCKVFLYNCRRWQAIQGFYYALEMSIIKDENHAKTESEQTIPKMVDDVACEEIRRMYKDGKLTAIEE